ncbi:ABC transporter substrate-binding protein [Nitrosococcus watsonii]|uniref:Extracellular solute-binding protein family 1 n=1 Tax=Nitrosococcus watsoni (strain C-113) TaxID=105559 RepID=D8K9R4_NITWC|nr:ABC transporter substrate-binding protein [Nitrosococcus watsonii]ADJ27353.1 extracellular solute-binding protein family 1 [Nitrosococcus watsonii C-113]
MKQWLKGNFLNLASHFKAGIGLLFLLLAAACSDSHVNPVPTLKWYVFNEPSGAFKTAAEQCSAAAKGAYQVEIAALPADASEQRVQLARRLAAKDTDIDLIGMDVIWTAEFAEAGWILPWPGKAAAQARQGRLSSIIASATYDHQLWGIPFTSNIQLLWYRTDQVAKPPQTWDELIASAEALGASALQVQGARYEGLTVLFNSLLASAGGSVLDQTGKVISLEKAPTEKALAIMKRLATSPATSPSLSIAREDESRLAFEGGSAFMINYTYVWPSAQQNAPQVAALMGWARWPAVIEGQPSRVTLGGINLSVGAYSQYPRLAFQAATCIASQKQQRLAAIRGGLLPTFEKLYADPSIREALPFADTLRATLKEAAQRPSSPLYNDISLAISRTLHPMKAIDPQKDTARLQKNINRALRSKGLL